MEKWPNILLVAGTNRNVGKTTFACKLISKMAQNYTVWGIKITPHIHLDCSSCKVLLQTNNLIISEELSNTTFKDSAKMRAAGAHKVIYIQGTDEKLPFIYNWVKENVPKNIPVICESAALINVLIPGKLVVLSKTNSETKHKELIPLADFYFENFMYTIDKFVFKANKWQYNY